MNDILLVPTPETFTMVRGPRSHPSGPLDVADRRGHGYHPVYVCNAMFNPMLCQKHPEYLFVFGDNTDRTGFGGQACIRNCENSFGIRTKKFPNTSPTSYFTDRDYLWFQKLIDDDIYNLLQLNRKKAVILAAGGYGTERAKLCEKAPKCYKYLCQRLNYFCGNLVFNPDYTLCT